MPTPPLTDLEIEVIALGLIDRSLAKSDWTHAAHWAAALWLIRAPNFRAKTDLPNFIRAFNIATNTPNTETSGYHETITQASLFMAHAWLERYDSTTALSEVLSELLNSPLGRSDWLFAYWSKSILFSPRARRDWVDPDLCALHLP